MSDRASLREARRQCRAIPPCVGLHPCKCPQHPAPTGTGPDALRIAELEEAIKQAINRLQGNIDRLKIAEDLRLTLTHKVRSV